jgi:ubiquinone/menaquinone biosynthesis C-methylase UbiE
MAAPLDRSDPILQPKLLALARSCITEQSQIREILERLCNSDSVLSRGLNKSISIETARIESVGSSTLTVGLSGFEAKLTPQLLLNFRLDGEPYRLTARILSRESDRRVVVAFPSQIFRAERRDRVRVAAASAARFEHAFSQSRELGVFASTGWTVLDTTAAGLAVMMPASDADGLESRLRLGSDSDSGPVATRHAEVRHITPIEDRPGWVRVGLRFTGASSLIESQPVARGRGTEAILGRSISRLRLFGPSIRLALSRLTPRRLSKPIQLQVIDFSNRDGEKIKAIVDSWGETRGAPAVVIPPAWGRTKETLLPLAATIVESFKRAGQPVVIVRFDGIRKRGESYNDPECRARGAEHLGFTFSQGVRDIEAVLDFLQQDERFQTKKAALVTFSASSIEGRRAVASESHGRLAGWVCVVGSADLQSMMRSISGGIDFVAGIERGLEFGLQEILGVVVDIDHAGRDAIENQLGFLEDACTDFERISVPITWLHGRYDAWMDLERVRHALSFGETRNRKLVVIPTGHQLRSSREAIETFGSIAESLAPMISSRPVKRVVPDLASLEERQRVERERVRGAPVDYRAFWRQYLLGREGSVGIELMTNTSPHQELMRTQLEMLSLRTGARVADLGSGTGSFLQHLAEDRFALQSVTVHNFDFVASAHRHARERLCGTKSGCFRTGFVACDLGHLGESLGIPVRDESYDAVLGSLLISYLSKPQEFIAEVFRILRPAGRLVLSSLKPDADVAGIFYRGLAELQSGMAKLPDRLQSKRDLDVAARGFLNDAARLIDFEEMGEFKFWDADELSRLVRVAGFTGTSVVPAFGDPCQAFVVTARKPSSK